MTAETAAGKLLERRTWAYVQPPKAFDVAPCSCGNAETQWSEFKAHLWCGKCEKDFVPEHAGLFDGPIPIRTAAMMGLLFDRYLLPSLKVEVFDLETFEYRQAEHAEGGNPAPLAA